MWCLCSLSCVQLFIFGLIALYIFYKWSIATFDFFAKRNIAYEKPFPLLGNYGGIFMQKETLFDLVKRLYVKYKKRKYYGTFMLRKPLITIADPELIKQLAVKEFESFHNHTTFFESQDAPLLCNSLLFLKDQKWKDMRATLSPAFTGKKLRQMFPFILKCCHNCIDHLKNMTQPEGYLNLDIKEVLTRFLTDVIASTAFGLEINSLKNKENEFYRTAQRGVKFSFEITLRVFFYLVCKRIARALRIKLVDEKLTTYFHQVVLDTIKYRIDKGIVRPDMINLLIQSRQGTLKAREVENDADHGFAAVHESHVGLRTVDCKWSDVEMVAQCFIFFIAGYATSSSAMCFCVHEIMTNPDVQTKLIAEIDETRARLNGKEITYEDLQQMRYLDMVLSESLRMWPPNVTTDRVCNEYCTLHNENIDDTLEIEPGHTIEIPLAGLHFDPEYWPEPEKFDPDRFSDENKANIKPFTYMPFGVGPRNCIGSRFALMQIKAILFHLLSEFTFERSPRSSIPPKLLASGFQYDMKEGFWIDLKPRQK